MVNSTVADFKAYFVRDFTYGSTSSTVMDVDIQKGIDQAAVNINPDLFASQAAYTIGFLSLSAHYMVMDLRAGSQGTSGNFSWMETGKSVGSVSQNFAIPQHILDHPVLGMLSKTNYGAKYLGMVLSSMVGLVVSMEGATLA